MCIFVRGYQQQTRWPQIELDQAAVPLLSRREYESASYDQTSYNLHHMESQRELLRGGQTLRVDPQHERLLGMEDDYPSAAAMPSALATSSQSDSPHFNPQVAAQLALSALASTKPAADAEGGDVTVLPSHS